MWCKPVIPARGDGNQQFKVIRSYVTSVSLRVSSGIHETKQFCLKNERERELWGEALVDVPNGLVKGLEDTCIHKQELVLFLHMLSLVLSSHVCLCWGGRPEEVYGKAKTINKIKIKKKSKGWVW